MAGATKAGGPDFSRGVSLRRIPTSGVLAGRVGDESVLLARRPDGVFAVSGACTHYGGPMAEGLAQEDVVRCPWHHACFDLRTGEAVSGPAFDALKRWRVDVEGSRVFVREALPAAVAAPRGSSPERIVIVGGGAAGFAAAEKLRRLGFRGSLTMLSADADLPCDRPNLSKDYLAGTAPADWVPLKGRDFYAARDIDLRLATTVERLDVRAREAVTTAGDRFAYDTLLLATGAEPIRLPGFDHPRVHVLRSQADAEALIAALGQARIAAIIGASFIGLEVAAALRTRGLEVHVVAPEDVPMAPVLGSDLGRMIADLHAANGVRLHLGAMAQSYDGETLRLVGGGAITADLVVMGVGVRPRLALAEAAGLKVDRGVVVDAFLRTSADGIYAAGDIARYPDPRSGTLIRVEHWVHACRQGQIAAANMLGARRPAHHAPFFWSHHYDLSVRYVGHAVDWHTIVVDGNLRKRSATIGYFHGRRLLAAASIGRDRQNLEIEAGLENLAAPPEMPRSGAGGAWRRLLGNLAAGPASNAQIG